MSTGRHSYVRFFASDWIAGTARMTPMQELVYLRICCVIWDKAAPCPEAELPLMLGSIDGWDVIVENLVAAGKLEVVEGGIVNARAMEEAMISLELWERKSAGGRRGARAVNKQRRNDVIDDVDDVDDVVEECGKRDTPDDTPDDTLDETAVDTPDETGGGVSTHNQNQNQNHNQSYSSSNTRGREAMFDQFWEAYPHKVGKKAARKSFDTAIKTTDIETMLTAVRRYISNKPADRQFCNPATWLNQGRWEDVPAEGGTRANVSQKPQGPKEPPISITWEAEPRDWARFRNVVKSRIGSSSWKVYWEKLMPHAPGTATAPEPPQTQVATVKGLADHNSIGMMING